MHYYVAIWTLLHSTQCTITLLFTSLHCTVTSTLQTGVILPCTTECTSTLTSLMHCTMYLTLKLCMATIDQKNIVDCPVHTSTRRRTKGSCSHTALQLCVHTIFFSTQCTTVYSAQETCSPLASLGCALKLRDMILHKSQGRDKNWGMSMSCLDWI